MSMILISFLQALLLMIFAAIALGLAVIGIYGVVSYSVAQRTHEIGIRIALGAQQRDILKLVLGHALILALAGITIGLAMALMLSRTRALLLLTDCRPLAETL